MKELIRKDKLISWSYGEPKYDDSRNDRTDMRDYINELPTVTEQEIRNKAIDDFFDKALNFEDYIEPINEDNGTLVYSGKDITNMIVTIAEELKGK